MRTMKIPQWSLPTTTRAEGVLTLHGGARMLSGAIRPPFSIKQVTTMKSVNKAATKVLEILTADLTGPGDHKRIDKSDGTFMAVVVEHIGWCGCDPVFSVAHYYEQNGDLMRDPEMMFLRGHNEYYPVYFRQDGLPVEERSVLYDTEGVIRYYPRLQTDHVRFANAWMRNIKDQQCL